MKKLILAVVMWGTLMGVAHAQTVTAAWPPNKRTQLVAGRDYTSNYPVVRVAYTTKGNTVTAITFTDNRGCVDPDPKP